MSLDGVLHKNFWSHPLKPPRGATPPSPHCQKPCITLVPSKNLIFITRVEELEVTFFARFSSNVEILGESKNSYSLFMRFRFPKRFRA